MQQVLAIFRKDVKHLWPYGALMAALLALDGWLDVQLHDDYLKLLNTYPISTGPVLLFLAWWCLAGLVVQQERVPCDRQYWRTRPISRKSLFGAKILFLVAFVCVPSFLAQAIVLAVTGFSPIAWLPALLWNQVLISTLFIVAAALAAVTSNYRQYVLSTGLVLAILIWTLPKALGDEWGGVQWVGEAACQVALLAGAAAVLILQYTRRRTVLARAILAVTVVIAALVVSPAVWHAAFAFQSAITRNSAPGIAVAFDSSRSPVNPMPQFSRIPNNVRVAIPVRITGIPSGRELISERVSATVQVPGGGYWSSGWREANAVSSQPTAYSDSDDWLRTDGSYWLNLDIPMAFYENMQHRPANLRVAMAFTLFTSPQIAAMPADPQQYRVPGAGDCTLQEIPRHYMLGCVTPFRRTAAVDFQVHTAGGDSPWSGSGCCLLSYGPVPVNGSFSVWADTGFMSPHPGNLSPNDRIPVEVRRPVSFVERRLEIHDIPLARYVIRSH